MSGVLSYWPWIGPVWSVWTWTETKPFWFYQCGPRVFLLSLVNYFVSKGSIALALLISFIWSFASSSDTEIEASLKGGYPETSYAFLLSFIGVRNSCLPSIRNSSSMIDFSSSCSSSLFDRSVMRSSSSRTSGTMIVFNTFFFVFCSFAWVPCSLLPAFGFVLSFCFDSIYN